MIQPLADRIVIREDEINDEETSFGIIIASENKRSRHREGTVISAGRGRFIEYQEAEDGSSYPVYAPSEIIVGDRVVFTFADEYIIKGEKLCVLKEQDVLAIIKE